MKPSRLRMAALGALSLALLGCASSNSLKTTGLLGAVQGKDAAGSGAMDTTFDPEAALRQAQDLRKAADFQGAAKLLSQLVLVSPDDTRVLGEYSKTLIGLGRTDDALAFVDRAIELQPEDWSLYSARGVALDQKKDYRAAQASYDQALALKPGEPTVLSNAALSHMQAGDLAGAEKLLLQAAQAGGEIPRIASNLALVRSLRSSATKAPPALAAPPPPSSPRATATPSVPSVEHRASVETPKPPTPVGVEPSRAPIVNASPAPAANQVRAPHVPTVTTSSALPAVPSAPSSVESPKTAPNVYVQAVPKDPKAGPVAPKKVTEKKETVPAPANLSTAAFALRPALTEGPALRANAQTK